MLASKLKKRRSQAEKVGRLVYILELEKRILKEIAQLCKTQRYVIMGSLYPALDNKIEQVEK